MDMKNKIGLRELALKVTKRNLEKKSERLSKEPKVKRFKSKRKTPKQPIVIVKSSGGSVAYVPEGMKYSSVSKRIEKNEDAIIDFKLNEDNLIRI